MVSTDPLLDMIRALAVEARARRGLDGGERVEVLGGRRTDVGSAVTYRFVLRSARRALREGEAVYVLRDGTHTLGMVTSAEERGRVEVSVGEDLGLTVPEAILVRDDSYLIEALREPLKAMRRGGPYNRRLALQVLNGQCWSHPLRVAHANALSGTLNEEQELAVAAMALSGVVVVWGPPGTGKTRTLAVGAVESARGGRSIALLAHTNIAVDGLLECFLDELGPERLPEDAVVRVGELSSPTLQAKYGRRVAFEAIIERWRARLEPAMQELGMSIARSRVEVRQLDADVEADGAKVESAHRQLDELCHRAAVLEREYDAVPSNVIAEAQVVATTVHRAYLPGHPHRRMDVVVVDEASMVPRPMAVFAASLATQTAVFAGDPRQLGTITKSRAREVRKHVASSVFDGAPSGHRNGSGPILLRQQYRMAPEIAVMLNDLTYGPGTLLTPAVVREREKPRLGLLTSPISYVDTSQLEPHARIPRGTWTRVNDVHARVVAQLLGEVARGGRLGVPSAVITPYWGQARRLRTEIPPTLKPHAEVATVHRFQGSERPVVLFDIADAPGARLSKFMRIRHADDDGGRLVTVAMSRAAFHLVVIADFAFLEEEASPFAFVRRLLAYLRKNATPIVLPSRMRIAV